MLHFELTPVSLSVCLSNVRLRRHRDLKPANLLLADPDDDTSIRLADFGMAESVRNGPLTESCGTPYFMAPEIWDGRPYGKVGPRFTIGGASDTPLDQCCIKSVGFRLELQFSLPTLHALISACCDEQRHKS